MKLFKTVFCALFLVFNLFATILIAAWLLYIGNYTLTFFKFNIQIILHFIFAIISVILLWINLFIKMKYIKKLFVIGFSFILFFSSIFFPKIIDILKFSNCYEDNFCIKELQK